MKYCLLPAIAFFLLVSCSKEKEELNFRTETYSQKTKLPCAEECPVASVTIPIAEGIPVVADSINQKVFSTMKGIVYFGEKPFPATDYNSLLQDFMAAYETIQEEDPEEKVGWEAKVEGSVVYESDSILNIKLEHYTYTGGAHGYSGKTSLMFNPKTGKSIPETALFKNREDFKNFAETKFRQAYKISEKDSLNHEGRFMFENSKFILPQTYFYTDKGLLLYYNVYEIASFAEGPKEVLIPYSEMQPYLKVR